MVAYMYECVNICGWVGMREFKLIRGLERQSNREAERQKARGDYLFV